MPAAVTVALATSSLRWRVQCKLHVLRRALGLLRNVSSVSVKHCGTHQCQTDACRYTGLRSTSSTYHRCALRGAIKKFCNLATKSYHIICCHFLIIMQHQWLFSTFVLCCLCFDNRIFSVLTLRPCIHSDLQWFIVHKPGSTKTVLQISY